MHNADITLKNLTKIEGKASLEIKMKNKKEVKSVKLKVDENNRFFELAAIGKNINQIPSLFSRVCGTCSVSHLLCSLEAIEKALAIKQPKQTIVLRKLLSFGDMIRDHALHLYIFVLPDVLNFPSILEFNKKHHNLIHDCFDLKATGSALSALIGGRAIHPMNVLLGGFSKVPKEQEIKKVIKKLKENKNKVINLIELLSEYNSPYARKSNFSSLITSDYSFLEGFIQSSSGNKIKESDYAKHLHEFIIPYSKSKEYSFNEKEFMVGALARINLNKKNLNKKTRATVKKYLKFFPSNDVFLNNLAQAIELLHCIDESIELLSNNSFKEKPLEKQLLKDGSGTGVLEAPRGTLYYHFNIFNNLIQEAKLIIPTSQNIMHIENTIKYFFPSMIEKGKKHAINELEKLIRSYDPCMSCATHFLKVKVI